MAKVRKTVATAKKPAKKKKAVDQTQAVIVKTATDVATVQAVAPRATILIGEENRPVMLSNDAGMWDMLRKLGKRVCFVQLLMRGKVHEMSRKYHPDTDEPNPYWEKVVKYSKRSGWLNRDQHEVLAKFLAATGQEQRELQEHRYLIRDEKAPFLGAHKENGTRYFCINPQEEWQYSEDLRHSETFETVTREALEPYCGNKPDTFHKNAKLSNVIEISGGFWMKVFGERKWIRFRFRNIENISEMETAIADALPLVTERASDFDNEPIEV